MTDGRGIQRNSQRAGMASARYGQNIEQDLWTGFPHGVAATNVTLDYDDQALLQRSLHHVHLHQNVGQDSQLYQGMPHAVAMPSETANFWRHEDLARIKNEVSAEEVHESYVDACDEHEREGDQVPLSSKGTSSTPMPSRPHAAVEKRYRRTVNTKLQQLHAAIPPSGSFSLDPSERARSSTDDSEPEQAAKPVVLDKAIQYTTHLIGTYRKYDDDIKMLRQQVREWLGEDRTSFSPVDNNTERMG